MSLLLIFTGVTLSSFFIPLLFDFVLVLVEVCFHHTFLNSGKIVWSVGFSDMT